LSALGNSKARLPRGQAADGHAKKWVAANGADLPLLRRPSNGEKCPFPAVRRHHREPHRTVESCHWGASGVDCPIRLSVRESTWGVGKQKGTLLAEVSG